MGFPRVKLNIYNRLPLGLVLLALVSFMAAWSDLLPARFVEDWYSRGVFPLLSALMAPLAAMTGGSLLDVLLPGSVLLVAYLLYRRRFLPVLGLLAAGYLIFFWTWGLNYHRLPVEAKVDFRSDRVSEETIAALVREAASEINRTYVERGGAGPPDYERALVDEADSRIRTVIEAIDGPASVRWNGVVRVKSSVLLNPLFRAGSVSGMFNPFGHEALVTGGLLPFERSMVMLHEIAHVRGYAHEGEANFIALLAAVGSADPELRYSGWLSLWMYMRSAENNRLLDDGPLRDLEAIDQRIRETRVVWVSRTQGRTLDVFLRANRVEDGIRSYARIVQLAAGTRHLWNRFEAR